MKKRRGRVFFIALGCSLLFIIFFPKTYAPEPYFTGSWETAIRSNYDEVPEHKLQEIVPFRSGSHFGYITSHGEIVYTEPIFYNVTFSEEYFINYAAVTENLLVKDISGKIIQAISTTGYPTVMNNRLFVIDKDRCGMSEWDIQGNIIWERRFSSIITAFDCNEEHVIVGFLNGEIMLLDRETKEVFRDIPTGSRIRVIYGLALAPGEEFFAVMMGIDPQRLVIYRRGETGYRPHYSEIPGGNYRRETFIQFLDEKALFYEQPGRLVQHDISRKETSVFKISGVPRKVILYEKEQLIMINHAGDGGGGLDIYTTGGMPLSYFRMLQDTSFHFHKGSLFFTEKEKIKKIDIRGEAN